MFDLQKEVRETISEIYGELSRDRNKALLKVSMVHLAGVKENDRKRDVKIITAIMDAYDQIEASRRETDTDWVKDVVVVNAPSDEISWEDIKSAFANDSLFKSAEFEQTREDSFKNKEEQKDDWMYHRANEAVDPQVNDYIDFNKGDEYDEAARAYPAKSLKPDVPEGTELQLGLDKRMALQPGNLLDEAVDVGPRGRVDFSMSR